MAAPPSTPKPLRLLLVEDKDSFRKLLVQTLEGGAWEVAALGDPKEALRLLGEGAFDLLVTDLRLPGLSGLELLKSAKRLQPHLRAVVMSAFGEPADIVEAIRWGADDFLAKPFDLQAFLDLLERLRALGEAPAPDPREPWIKLSPPMAALERALGKAAETSLPVLFCGEPGSGKARAARRLHTLRHPAAPFLQLRASSVGPGARELALLQGGSLYVTDLDLPASAAGVLEAMEGPLGRGVHWMGGCREAEAIPEALRLRMGVLTLKVPPLRERREDLLPLLATCLELQARRDGRSVPIVGKAVERELLGRTWPGNVRQLAWAVTQALAATGGAMLADLPPEGATPSTTLLLPFPEPGTLEAMLGALTFAAEGALLRRAMEGRRPEAELGFPALARELGLTPRALARALREHGIALEDE